MLALGMALDRPACSRTAASRIMAGGWIAFFAALIVSQQTLEDVWTAVRDLPLAVKGVVWLLAFPFLVGLAIWQASWEQPVRVVAVAVLAVSYTYMFMPRERRRR
jgi:hypothetical protein